MQLKFDEKDFCHDIEDDYIGKLYNEIGEAADSWEIPVANAVEPNAEIGKLIAEYLTKHGLQPSCFKVVDIEEVK